MSEEEDRLASGSPPVPAQSASPEMEEVEAAALSSSSSSSSAADVGEKIKLDATPEPSPSPSMSSSANADDDDVAPLDQAKVVREEVVAIQESKKTHREHLKQLRDKQNAELSMSKSANADARLRFLQQQVEVFSRFTSMGDGGSSAPSSSTKEKKGGRTRMTEEEEDKQLLAEGKKGVRATRLTVQPGCVKGGKMRAYQIEGLNWMINLYEQGINGILADEMGLGKTLQSISLLGYLKFDRGVSGPHIVVVPKAVLTNWLREFAKWVPDLRVISIHGSKEERARQISEDMRPGSFDVCVTTYEVLMIERSAFMKFQWRYIVVDEAHRLKSEATKTAQLVRQLDTQFRLLVTGTPLQNNLHELWALLNFLLPEVFEDASLFEEYFKLEDMAEESVVSKLHAILRPFMIRRLKSDVEKSLPPKREIKLHTGLSEMQEYWYKTILNRDVAVLNQLGGPDRSRLLNILMQLRKVCNHPYLFQGAEPGPPYVDGPHIWENSGKLFLVDKLLSKLRKNGDRVLIFSQMTRMLDVLEDYMRFKGYDYCRIDGSTKGEDRDAQMDVFNAPGSSKFVFLLSTRAGGLGINLATANVVILYDSDWNPQMDLQAQDRAHRIGQTKEVTVFRLVTEGTVEEKIVERAEKKLYLDAVVVQQGRLQQANAALSKNELMTMVKFGAETIFRAGGKRVTDEDIDAILERDTKRTEEMREKFKTDVQHNLLNFRLDAGADTSVLLGADPKVEQGGNFINLPSRARHGREGDARSGPGAAGDEGDKEPPKPKGLLMNDFQFFRQSRIREIEEQEHEWTLRRRVQAGLVREAKLREKRERLEARRALTSSSSSASPAPEDEEDEAQTGQEESTKLQEELDAMRIPDDLRAEKTRLVAEGFSNWNRRDFRAYAAAVERFGRNNTDDIVAAIAEQTSKNKAEVLRYHNTFWERYTEIADWEKIIDRVKKGEEKIARREQITQLLNRKVASTASPWQTLQIEYGPNRGKAFTEDEDRFLVCTMQRLGYGNWDQIRQELRKSWVFRFDWFIKSRTAIELARRCDALIRMIENEEKQGGGGSSNNVSIVEGGGASGATGAAASTGGGNAGAARKRRNPVVTNKSPTPAAAANEDAEQESKRVKVK